MKALRYFIDNYSKFILKTISYILNNSYEAQFIEECYDDVIMIILKKCNSYEYNASFKTWIGTIAKNKALDYKRRIKKEITIHKDKESIYFVVNTLDGKEKALQSFLDEREELIDKIADENIKVNYSNERFNCEEKEILKKESILLGIIFAIIMIAWIIKQVQMFL